MRKFMKNFKINKTKSGKKLLPLIMAFIALIGCNDMLHVDSERLTAESDYNLNAPGDSVYSMFGILSKLQKLGDSYVLLGELRGDLLDVGSNSDVSLKEINNFDISSQNEYVNIKDYYDVINNCNYVIQKLDTSVVDKGLKMKLRAYAAVKTIRAWTYMQLALNFQTVKYLEKPVLTVEDAEKDYSSSEISLLELANKLIADLEPLKLVENPELGFLDSYNSSNSYFPIRFVLGDLYLWRGSLTANSSDYENAAIQYRMLMYEKRQTINGERDNLLVPTVNSSSSYWIPINGTITSNANLYWIKSLTIDGGEVLTTIACPTEYGQSYKLDTLNSLRSITPSAVAIKNWDSQTYYLNEASNTMGDLRKYGSISYNATTNSTTATIGTDYNFSGMAADNYLIYKYRLYKQNVVVYRSSLLYLRYAEAVNRLEKPKLAFAVLKYGLNSNTLLNDKMIPVKEKGSTLAEYMNFFDSRFKNNVGIRMRGLGNLDKDTTFYTIPKLNSMKDSMLYVEDKIEQELALETAFEGNRYHDLMRIALRRIKNNEGDEAYLANKVAEKHTGNKVTIRNKLMTIDNWYIKK